MIAPAPPVDLAAERAASIARRDREHRDTSARVLLRVAGGGARPGTLEEWCEHQHPAWTPEQRTALVARALELQAEELAAQTRTPDATMPLPTTFRVLPSDEVFTDRDERAALEERMRTRRYEPLPAAPAAAEEPMPETENDTLRPSTSDVRRVITEILTAAPATPFAEVQSALEARYGVPFKVGHMGKAWARVRTELGLDEPRTNGAHAEEPAAAPGPDWGPESESAAEEETPPPAPAEVEPEPEVPEAEPEATEPETVEPPAPPSEQDVILHLVTTGTRRAEELGEQSRALLEENRSLRETYESEGIHLEEEDGEWRLRVNLLFDNREEALRMLGRFFGMRVPA